MFKPPPLKIVGYARQPDRLLTVMRVCVEEKVGFALVPLPLGRTEDARWKRELSWAR